MKRIIFLLVLIALAGNLSAQMFSKVTTYCGNGQKGGIYDLHSLINDTQLIKEAASIEKRLLFYLENLQSSHYIIRSDN